MRECSTSLYRSVDFLRERRAEPEATQPLAHDRRTFSPTPWGQPSSIDGWPHGFGGEILRSAPGFNVEASCGAAPPSGSHRCGRVIDNPRTEKRSRVHDATNGYEHPQVDFSVGARAWSGRRFGAAPPSK